MGGSVTPPLEDSRFSCVPQYDGNVSIVSDLSSDTACVNSCDYSFNQPISVQAGFRPFKTSFDARLPPVRKTIVRNNKVLQAVSLPKMSSYNMRSLMPKIGNFGTDMQDRNCGI